MSICWAFYPFTTSCGSATSKKNRRNSSPVRSSSPGRPLGDGDSMANEWQEKGHGRGRDRTRRPGMLLQVCPGGPIQRPCPPGVTSKILIRKGHRIGCNCNRQKSKTRPCLVSGGQFRRFAPIRGWRCRLNERPASHSSAPHKDHDSRPSPGRR